MREFGSLLNFPVNYLSQTPVQIINCSSPIPRRYLCMSTFVHEDEAGDKKDPALLAERWAKAHFIKLLFRRIDENGKNKTDTFRLIPQSLCRHIFQSGGG